MWQQVTLRYHRAAAKREKCGRNTIMFGEICRTRKEALIDCCVVQITVLPHKQYSKTPLIRINWDGESSGHAENPDNWIFCEYNHQMYWIPILLVLRLYIFRAAFLPIIRSS